LLGHHVSKNCDEDKKGDILKHH